ncbi:hypothetical protein [Streptomyces sp. NRRL F-5755]|uniref:hypothetical protein n=1 Tax=Streptomyces sp. NRRL F-5755 TaxID=1519475 RepID=UPI000A4F8428|nr:hypothetical protein [Streptomyces sp. NRRL F-5755]
MAGRWMDFGRYNAQGMGGGDALGYGIERMVTGLQSSPHSERDIAARLRYLTASEAGYAAMERAGINVMTRTLYAWLAEERSPNAANRLKLDEAYWDLRRRNVAADLKRRLMARATVAVFCAGRSTEAGNSQQSGRSAHRGAQSLLPGHDRRPHGFPFLSRARSFHSLSSPAPT